MEKKVSNRERFLFFVLGIIGLVITAFYGFNEYPLLEKATLSLPPGLGGFIEDGGGLIHYVSNKTHYIILSFIICFAVIFQVKNKNLKDIISESNQILMLFVMAFTLITFAYSINFHLWVLYLG
ncbi:hypothetical protein [Pantoea agglomerans]|uniref:hypothetical protein n=1 Tax=Enterobacter agglomerans TaxID=549 RepID=UPI003C7B8475